MNVVWMSESPWVMKTLYNPKPLLLLSGTVAGSPGSRWELVAKTMCLTQFRCETTIRAGWGFFFSIVAAQLSVLTHCHSPPSFFSSSILLRISALLQPDRSPRRLAERSCHLALPVITDIVHIAQSVSTTLTSAVSPPSHQLCRDVISESAFHALRVWHSDLFAARFLWLPPSLFFFFFSSFFPLWLLRDATLQVLAAVPAIPYVCKRLFVQVGRASARKIDRTS